VRWEPFEVSPEWPLNPKGFNPPARTCHPDVEEAGSSSLFDACPFEKEKGYVLS
jgi:hypothetical protein